MFEYLLVSFFFSTKGMQEQPSWAEGEHAKDTEENCAMQQFCDDVAMLGCFSERPPCRRLSPCPTAGEMEAYMWHKMFGGGVGGGNGDEDDAGTPDTWLVQSWVRKTCARQIYQMILFDNLPGMIAKPRRAALQSVVLGNGHDSRRHDDGMVQPFLLIAISPSPALFHTILHCSPSLPSLSHPPPQQHPNLFMCTTRPHGLNILHLLVLAQKHELISDAVCRIKHLQKVMGGNDVILGLLTMMATKTQENALDLAIACHQADIAHYFLSLVLEDCDARWWNEEGLWDDEKTWDFLSSNIVCLQDRCVNFFLLTVYSEKAFLSKNPCEVKRILFFRAFAYIYHTCVSCEDENVEKMQDMLSGIMGSPLMASSPALARMLCRAFAFDDRVDHDEEEVDKEIDEKTAAPLRPILCPFQSGWRLSFQKAKDGKKDKMSAFSSTLVIWLLAHSPAFLIPPAMCYSLFGGKHVFMLFATIAMFRYWDAEHTSLPNLDDVRCLAASMEIEIGNKTRFDISGASFPTCGYLQAFFMLCEDDLCRPRPCIIPYLRILSTAFEEDTAIFKYIISRKNAVALDLFLRVWCGSSASSASSAKGVSSAATASCCRLVGAVLSDFARSNWLAGLDQLLTFFQNHPHVVKLASINQLAHLCIRKQRKDMDDDDDDTEAGTKAVIALVCLYDAQIYAWVRRENLLHSLLFPHLRIPQRLDRVYRLREKSHRLADEYQPDQHQPVDERVREELSYLVKYEIDKQTQIIFNLLMSAINT